MKHILACLGTLVFLTGCVSSTLTGVPWGFFLGLLIMPFFLSACGVSVDDGAGDKDKEEDLQMPTIFLPTSFDATNLVYNIWDNPGTGDYIIDLVTHSGLTFDGTGASENSFLVDESANYYNQFIFTPNRSSPNLVSQEKIVVRSLPYAYSELNFDLQGGPDLLAFSSTMPSQTFPNFSSLDVDMGAGKDILIPGSQLIDTVDLGSDIESDLLVLQRVANASEFALDKDIDKIILANGLGYDELTFEAVAGGTRILAPVSVGSGTRVAIAIILHQGGFASLTDVESRTNFVEDYLIE